MESSRDHLVTITKADGSKVSGHVKRPGIYEAPVGITLRELIDAR